MGSVIAMGAKIGIAALFVYIGIQLDASWVYYLLVTCVGIAEACEVILKSISEEIKK